MAIDRTKEFFSQPIEELNTQLTENGGMIIVDPVTDRSIRLTETKPYPKVGSRWNALARTEVGTLWNPNYFRIIQSLITAKGTEKAGACIRLVRAEYFDQSSGLYVTDWVNDSEEYHQTETDISRYLGLKVNDRSRLAFVDNSNRLNLYKPKN
jgi:hypothetical protein